ncbi:substrate-binding domain-containing protein [Spiroplasma endosymbiont of Stenodema calcarata]|uniref:substrate-binding domain-containing protein n=1 Tax=Spiroplasma endosymbiont of Stenodema calcarata TaxID=3139328 RepID=UPI003CCB00BC
MKRILSFVTASVILFSLSINLISCNFDRRPKIAFIVSTKTNPYFQIMLDEARTLANQYGYGLNEYDSSTPASPNGDTGQELTNVQNAIIKGDLAIIINPVDSTLYSAARIINAANVPFVSVDRAYQDRGYQDYIFATDNVTAAQKLQEDIYAYLTTVGVISQTNPQIKVYELWGTQNSNAAQDRHQGFMKSRPDQILNVTGDTPQVANFDMSQAVINITQNINKVKTADVIFTHNDNMALGAIQGLKQAAPKWLDKHHLVIGFDAITDALNQIENWESNVANMFATVQQQPTLMAEQAVLKAITMIKNGRPVIKDQFEKIDVHIIKPKKV